MGIRVCLDSPTCRGPSTTVGGPAYARFDKKGGMRNGYKQKTPTRCTVRVRGNAPTDGRSDGHAVWRTHRGHHAHGAWGKFEGELRVRLVGACTAAFTLAFVHRRERMRRLKRSKKRGEDYCANIDRMVRRMVRYGGRLAASTASR